jgi:hypothetical protein
LDLFDPGVQLQHFPLRNPFPSLGNRSRWHEAKEQLPNFVESKSCFLRPPYDGQPVEHRLVVSPLSTHAMRGQQDADLLVVANC